MAQLSMRRNLAWMGGSSVLGQVITWSVTIMVARILSPDDYGLIALSGLFTVFAISISEMGVGTAVIQQEKITQEQVSGLYSFSIAVGILMGLVGFFIAPYLAFFFSDTRIIALTRFQSLIFLVSACKSMQRTVLVRDVRFDVIAKIETSSRILTSLCTLLLAHLGAGVWALAAQWLFIEFFQFLGFGWISRIRPTLRIDFDEIRNVLSFGCGVMFRNIFYKIYAMTDATILGYFAGKEFLGAYAFSKQLTNMPFEKILRLVNQILYPYLSKIKSDTEKLGKWTLHLADIETLTLVPFFLLLFFCADEVIDILLGLNWQQAALPMRIFCVANIFKLVENYNSTLLTAIGEIRAQVKFSFIQLVAIAGGMFLSSKYLDSQAAIYVWITFYPLIVLWQNNFMLKKIDLRYRIVWGHLKTSVLCHCFMIVVLIFVTMCLHAGTWEMLFAKVILGGGSFMLSVTFLDKHRALESYSLIVKSKTMNQV